MEYSPSSSSCQHALLARSPLGHVTVCPDCAVVHLSLNCVSVRLEVEASAALAEMLNRAQECLHGSRLAQGLGHGGQACAVH